MWLPHTNFYEGAGISTAAGIGDFRGIHGKWTTQDKVKQYGTLKSSESLCHFHFDVWKSIFQKV